jgi:hypothetical protein
MAILSTGRRLYITRWQPPDTRRRNGCAYRLFEAFKEGLPDGDSASVEIVWGRYVLFARNAEVQLERLDRRADPECWVFDWGLIRQTWSEQVRKKCQHLVDEALTAKVPSAQ